MELVVFNMVPETRPISSHDLVKKAKQRQMSVATLYRHLRSLEEKGLICRIVDPRNRRNVSYQRISETGYPFGKEFRRVLTREARHAYERALNRPKLLEEYLKVDFAVLVWLALYTIQKAAERPPEERMDYITTMLNTHHALIIARLSELPIPHKVFTRALEPFEQIFDKSLARIGALTRSRRGAERASA